MKAIVYEKYGSPDVLELREVANPSPGDNEILIKVRAASVNSWDWDLLRGAPLIVRLVGGGGLFKPKHAILGSDIAGRVEAVGKNVRRFRPGDEVFGDLSAHGWGGFAEYVCAPENLLTRKSDKMTFVEAAAIPQAGLLALQGLRKKKLEPGHKVLINGAGGGVGAFAIQMAVRASAEVTGVDSADKFDAMRALGARHVIDYAREDYTRTGKRYDLILDVTANRSVFDYTRALMHDGRFVMVGGATGTILQIAALGPLRSRKGGKQIGILAWRPSTSDLDEMTALFEAGEVRPVIDGCYPLHKAAEALRHLGEGRVKGKIIITVEKNNHAK